MNPDNLASSFPWSLYIRSFFYSSLNIIIYLLIALFIMGFSQGYVIPLDLYIYDNVIALIYNIFTFHFLIYFLGLIMSLYPTYIFDFFSKNLSNKYYTSTCCGLMYFDFPKNDNKQEKPLVKNTKSIYFIEGAVRKFLGMLVFIIWSWLIVFVYYTHQIDKPIKIFVIVLNAVFTLVGIFTFWYYTYRVNKNQNIYDKAIKFAEGYYKKYLVIFLGILILFCALILFYNWHIITVIVQLIICLLLSIHLSIYRNFRSCFEPIKKITAFLNLQRKLGFIVLAFILAINFCTDLAEQTNPINIVLASLIAFYTVIIILFKVYLFLKNKNKSDEINYIPFIFKSKIKLNQYSIGLLCAFLFVILNIRMGSDLHKLKLIDSKDNKISLEEFYLKFKSVQDSTSQAPILYAAYGGGLKAHYWNYLILDELYNDSNFENVLAMSGVSGGGMGIGNYTAMNYFEFTSKDKATTMAKVKSSNILGIELSWLFGYDLLREYWLSLIKLGSDRSYRSMQYYSNLLDPSSELVGNTSMYDVYAKLFRDSSYYPNLIINSTSTSDKYGVVSAISNDAMFPGASNLLDINIDGQSKTLNYFESLSTCNRFPIISPAAKVPTKGNFVDGGYFENSGIMSLISFRNALVDLEKANYKDQEPVVKKKLRLVSVRNSKLNYFQSLLSKSDLINYDLLYDNCSKKSANDSELSSIIKGISNLDRMPNYIKSNLTENHTEDFTFIDIDLPYYIKDNEIEDLIGCTLDSATCRKIRAITKKSNDDIEKILKSDTWPNYKVKDWGIVDPPTARILSKPVEIYMEAMMGHPNVQKNLKKVIDRKE